MQPLRVGNLIKTRNASKPLKRYLSLTAIAAIFFSVSSGAIGEDETSVAVPVEPPSLPVLLKKAVNSRFGISPDGSKVFFMQWSPSGYFMMVHNTVDGEQMSDVPFGKSRPSAMRWLTSRRIIYSRAGEVFAVDFDGTNFLKLLSNYDDDRGKNYRKNFRAWSIKHLLPQDPEHILAQSWNSAGHPAIVRVNIYTGEELELVFEPRLDIDTWAVDRDGDVRLGVRRKKDELQLLTFDSANKKWAVYSDFTQDGTNTLGHSGETYLTKRVNLESFDYNNNHIYMATNRDSDRFKIVKYDIKNSEIVEDIFASDRYDVGGSENDHTSLLFHDPDKKLIGIRLDEERRKTIWFDERFESYQAIVDKHKPNHENRIFDWSDDAKVLLVFSSSDVDPGRYSIFHPDTRKVFTIAITNDELDVERLSKTKVVEFMARDGYALHGYLNPATGQDATERKLIVLPHGGPWARDNWRFDAWVQYFATRGYNVLRVNFRGSTGYGREHVLSGIKNIDTLMIDDIADGVHWAIQEGYAREGAVFIFGHSYGGYAALMSSVRYPDLYSAAVSWSAPVDMLAQLKKYKKEDEYFAYEFWKTATGDPKREKASLMRISPINNVAKMKLPLLIFHGEQDGMIPEEDVERLEAALKKAGNNAEVNIIDNEGHSFGNNSNITYVLEKSLRHFARYTVPEESE